MTMHARRDPNFTVATGWVIIHPNRDLELDYFAYTKWYVRGDDGELRPVTRQKWMKTYRPGCIMERATLTIPNLKKPSQRPRPPFNQKQLVEVLDSAISAFGMRSPSPWPKKAPKKSPVKKRVSKSLKQFNINATSKMCVFCGFPAHPGICLGRDELF